jgi:3D (Asp-Asp-Asp) domain-containing protein/peptidoglycan hydrolase CwlO-like protein
MLQFGTKRFRRDTTGTRTKSTSVTVHAVVARHFRSRTTRLAAVAVGTALVAVSSALASQTARQAVSTQGSRQHQALLELYALDSRLHDAQARDAYLTSEATRLRAEREKLRSELAGARITLASAQRQLAFQLRELYEQGEVDPLAVVFGATSLGNGLRELDDLERSAAQGTRIVAETRAAQRRLLHARRTLAADAHRLAQSLSSAQAAEKSLANSAATKSALVASLRANAGTTETAGLLSTAGAAATKSQTIGTGDAPPPQPPPRGGRKLTVSATCYILKGTTASGLPTGPGIVAVDPTVIPLGTKLYIPGYGKGVAADTGGGIKGNIIDLWYSTYAQCAKWGVRTVTITIY